MCGRDHGQVGLKQGLERVVALAQLRQRLRQRLGDHGLRHPHAAALGGVAGRELLLLRLERERIAHAALAHVRRLGFDGLDQAVHDRIEVVDEAFGLGRGADVGGTGHERPS